MSTYLKILLRLRLVGRYHWYLLKKNSILLFLISVANTYLLKNQNRFIHWFRKKKRLNFWQLKWDVLGLNWIFDNLMKDSQSQVLNLTNLLFSTLHKNARVSRHRDWRLVENTKPMCCWNMRHDQYICILSISAVINLFKVRSSASANKHV